MTPIFKSEDDKRFAATEFTLKSAMLHVGDLLFAFVVYFTPLIA